MSKDNEERLKEASKFLKYSLDATVEAVAPENCPRTEDNSIQATATVEKGKISLKCNGIPDNPICEDSCPIYNYIPD